MKNKRFISTFIIQLFCWTIIGLIGFANFQKPAQAYQSPDTFLGPIFYNQEAILKVFDHEYPLWFTVFGDDGNFSTMHYDGIPVEDDNGYYGYDQHTGIDYALSYEPVLAAASGTVQTAGWDDSSNHRTGYGLHVRINHPNGYTSIYGHLSSLAVQTDAEIIVNTSNPGSRQAIIGISGNTGVVRGGGLCPNVEDDHSCGQHLHFELRNSVNRPVNPYGWANSSTPDPWANYNPTATPPPPGTPYATGIPVWRGAVSDDVWLDYPANATAAAQYPGGTPVAQPAAPLPYITVDNADNDYSENPANCLQTETGGYNGDPCSGAVFG